LHASTIDFLAALPRARHLSPEQKKLSIDSIWSHGYLVENLLRGWTPERAEELDRQAREQDEAAAKSSPAQPQPQRMEYYLYFPRKRDATTAANRLRNRYDWETSVRKGADGKNWLTFAVADVPSEEDQIEEIREYLEGLADELGGEYDGWAMKTEPSAKAD
jgi:hypothetical protein